jgi:hypothetical protein
MNDRENDVRAHAIGKRAEKSRGEGGRDIAKVAPCEEKEQRDYPYRKDAKQRDQVSQ